ncbi:MAG: hypothetical protein HYT29_00895 [Parcubacteria group bacterium]|nr:hypothetical protein [Parcubacteria group bacterium]
MLYLFTGSDKEKARGKFRADVNALRAKKPDASFVEMDELSFSSARILELLATRGMFEKAVIAAFRNLLNNEEAAAFLAKNAKGLASSENVFLVCEEDATKTALAPLEKHADKVWRFTAQAARKEFPIVFPFAEAFLARDKKKAWILLQRILSENIPPEQIFGALFWQVKTAALVKKAQKMNSVGALGLKPFVQSKAERLCRGYSEQELTELLGEIVGLYHSREEGGLEPALALERLVLR